MRLKDKVALITGGYSGIGKATALLFVREGASVVITGRDEDKGARMVNEIQALGGRGCFVLCDVRRAKDCRNAVKTTVDQFGRLDILVNNAGVVIPGRVDNLDEQTWDLAMDTNVKAVYLMCREAIPVMRRQGGGVIVTNASDSGVVGEPNLAVYCASKGAAVLLSKAMAVDYAAENIRVNCVCPGPIYVGRWERRASAGGYDISKDVERFISDIPMGRVGSPLEVASTILFLASEESGFITGAEILVDGGRTAK